MQGCTFDVQVGYLEPEESGGCKLRKWQCLVGGKREMNMERKVARQGKRFWGQALTVVPEGRAAARHAFVVAASGLGALHPLVAALLRGTGRPSEKGKVKMTCIRYSSIRLLPTR